MKHQIGRGDEWARVADKQVGWVAFFLIRSSSFCLSVCAQLYRENTADDLLAADNKPCERQENIKETFSFLFSLILLAIETHTLQRKKKERERKDNNGADGTPVGAHQKPQQSSAAAETSTYSTLTTSSGVERKKKRKEIKKRR